MTTMRYKILAQACPANTANVTLYTVPANTNTIISTLSVCNLSLNNKTYNVCAIPSGDVIDKKHFIAANGAIAAYDSIALTIGMTLGANDSVLVAGQDANNIAFTIFGTEITEP
jgi:hypothetical protein